MRFTKEQNEIIDIINRLSSDKSIPYRKCYMEIVNIVPDKYETYEEWPKTLWTKVKKVLVKHNVL